MPVRCPCGPGGAPGGYGRVGAHSWLGRRGWRVAVRARARDGPAGGGSWGPRPSDALGDERRALARGRVCRWVGGNWGSRLGDELAGHGAAVRGAGLRAYARDGQAGESARDGGGVCRRIEHGRALSGESALSGGSSQGSTLCHTGARAGVVGGCLLAAVCWMRGQPVPTGAAHEGTPSAGVRGQV
jgi:hypothetical protein